MISLFKQIIKWLTRWDRRKFDAITNGMQLRLDYKSNKDALRVLETVFVEKEYALYFPFYEKATVIDVGAHYGYFSFFAAMNLHPDSTIYSLEPDANNFTIFQGVVA